MSRCRIYTSNDREALIEHIPSELWESRRTGHLDDVPWARASDHWQRIFREVGEVAITAAKAA